MSRPLRLVVDGRPLVGNRTGIGVHTAELASRLPFDPRPLLASHAPIRDRSALEELPVDVVPRRLGLVWQQRDLPAVARRYEADLVWGPHGTLPLSLATPAVVSIHDFTSITMPMRHELRTVLSFNPLIGPSLARAKGVAAVSRRTADTAMRVFGVPAHRIEIIPNGVASHFRPATPGSNIWLPEGLEPFRYLLYVGTIEPRKGIGELLDAWGRLPEPRPRLVLCGDPGWGLTALRARIEREIAAGGAVVTGFVKRETLVDLYRGAAAFVYPSWDEGFGLPPLEAMACGTPVIAARGGAIPEVLGDAARLVPPGDAAALGRELREVLGNPALRDELRERGRARAAEYSWDRSAERLAALMVRAAGR